VLAAQFARVVAAITSPGKEGAGNAGCQPHPQPFVRREKAHKPSHYRFRTASRHSPGNLELPVGQAVTGRQSSRHVMEVSLVFTRNGTAPIETIVDSKFHRVNIKGATC